MADCSASGTTIDRAVRSALGSSTTGQSSLPKQLGNLLGHAAVGVGSQQQAAAMPLAAPGQLVLPSSAGTGLKSPPPLASASTVIRPSVSIGHPSPMDAIWNNPPPAMSHLAHSAPAQHPALQQMHHPAAMLQQQQHSMQIMMQQQQQINMMMQQQQYQQQAILAQNQKRQQATLLKSQQQSSSKEESVQDVNGQRFEDWHVGLEEDAAQELRQLHEDDGTGLGHEGIVRGASIEELAAAWAEAEAEYESKLNEAYGGDLDHDVNNLWSGEIADPQETPYQFVNQSEAPPESMDWMAEGMKQFQDGNLKQAIYSFEMELQHENPHNSVAWRMLGRCHAENDQDPEAIKCLEAAVDRDPFSPEARLALGVSYVNELNHERALENLKAWFTHNPKYAGIDLPAHLEQDIYAAAAAAGPMKTREAAFEEVKHLLLTALDVDSSDAGDIYEALGVIYNVSKDYEEAANSFRKALESRPDDYQLWNKLGATYANGNQSEKALPAYHKALQAKPKYARAWLNMAISHSNLQDHDEAARCYLQTLSLNPSATHCWSYLRMALSSNEKWDLLPLVFSHDLKPFQEHYDFVLYDS